MYEKRFYREKMGIGFKQVNLIIEETDLWIAVPFEEYNDNLKKILYNFVLELRKELIGYIKKNPYYLKALEPLTVENTAPTLVNDMAKAARKAKVGPMAAVAGAFSQFVGQKILELGYSEFIIENGGDIFLKKKQSSMVEVFAGKSPFSGKIGLKIPVELTPLGICTSSGTVGHSLSFGNADAVVVLAKDTLLADAYATALANKIKTENDINPILETTKKIPEILGCLIIVKDKLGAVGHISLEPLS